MTEALEVPAGEFKARCLKLMDEVRATRRPIVITKRGKPVAKLVPVEEEAPPLFGRLKGTVTIHGDIISPIPLDWHAERGILYIGEDDDAGRAPAPRHAPVDLAERRRARTER